jgi:hypothetical protein
MIDAINFARSISTDVTAIYVEQIPGEGFKVKDHFSRWFCDVAFEVVPSPYRSIVGPILDYLENDDRKHNDGTHAALVLPELIPARWWQGMLHNQTALLLKAALLYGRRSHGVHRIIIDAPYYLKK